MTRSARAGRTARWIGIAPLLTLVVAASCSGESNDGVARRQQGLSNDLVIAEVYGGGGNNGATYDHDFVVLFNRSSAAVSLDGLMLQYASGSGDFGNNNFALPSASIPPGGYYLVQLDGGSSGSSLPTPDASSTSINLSGSNGKIALVKSVDGGVALDGCGSAGTPCDLTNVIDLVGYGSASQSETSPTAALSVATSAQRKQGGCTETDDNSQDFLVASPSPKNSASATKSCAAVSLDSGVNEAGDAIVAFDGGKIDASKPDAGSTDAGSDASTADAASDGGGSDAASDGGGSDAASDGGGSDAASDGGGSDAASDGGGSDAGGADAASDAGGADAASDAGGADAASDAGGADAASDAGGADAASDAGGADAASDAGIGGIGGAGGVAGTAGAGGTAAAAGAAGSPSGGSGGTGASAGGDAGVQDSGTGGAQDFEVDDGGCGCRTAPERSSRAGLVALLGLALLIGRRRRRS